MKRLIYILLVFLGFCSCQNDDSSFEISMPVENLSFRPIPGGAVMYYKLPSDQDILYIRVRYKDSFGKDMICSGSYACDSLTLLGFNEAQTGISARVSLCNKDDIESEPVEVTFNTKDSGPVTFLDNLEISPDWGSFFLKYNIPEDTKGMAHIFYVGENPVNKKTDTLLINSFVLTKGIDSLTIVPQQSRPAYDIVVRTEDFGGYIVKEKVWEKISPLEIDKQSSEDFTFLDPENLSIEDPAYNLGKAYLFDGDLKGESCYNWDGWDNFSTYLAGPQCLGKPLFIIDLKEQKLPAEFRLYAMLYVRSSFPYGPMDGYLDLKYGKIWTSCYATKLPSSVTVFGSNDMNDDSSWEIVTHFEQNREIDNKSRWCKRCNDGGDYDEYFIKSFDALQVAEPCYMKLSCPPDGKKYRYFKFVVNEVFASPTGWENTTYGSNHEKHVTIQELEIFTAKEN